MLKKLGVLATVCGVTILASGCGEENRAAEKPVKVTRCLYGARHGNPENGETMRLSATNPTSAPLSYDLELYWFDAQGHAQGDPVQMTTDVIPPGKTIAFWRTGWVDSSTAGWTCDVKVLGTN